MLNKPEARRDWVIATFYVLGNFSVVSSTSYHIMTSSPNAALTYVSVVHILKQMFSIDCIPPPPDANKKPASALESYNYYIT